MVMSLQDKVAEFNRRVSENPDLITAPAEKLFNAETDYLIASSLAESYVLCGIKVRPPSLGVVMLLTCIDSPFVIGERPATLKDIIEALFIIKHRQHLSAYILQKKETDVILARIEHEVRQNPLIYGIFMDKLMERKVSAYDHLLAEFSETLGAINLSESIISIGKYLGKPLKKNYRRKTFFGLPEIYARLQEKISTMFYGK